MRRKLVDWRVLVVTLLIGVGLTGHPALGVGTGFTFQGQLQQSGSLQNGPCDFQMSLFNAASGGSKLGATQTVSNVSVQEGLFILTLNAAGEFGATAFDGGDRWLEMALRCPAGSGAFGAAFNPRQPLTASPYALFASTSNSSTDVACSGCVAANDLASDSVTTIKILDNAVTSAKIADGTIVANDLANTAVTPAKIQPGSNGQVLTTAAGSVTWQNPVGGGSGWSLSGNAATNGNVNFLGTTDTQPLELRVNSLRVLRLEPGDAFVGPNLLAGDYRNYIATSVQGATVSGGGRGGSNANRVLDNFGTVGGGAGNKAGNGDSASGDGDVNNAAYATVGGGTSNAASGATGTVGGGSSNTAAGDDSSIGGGVGNMASGPSSTIAGGSSNAASALAASVGGGDSNSASQSFASVGGGNQNTASGDSACVAGGLANVASGASATIAGGSTNAATAQSATVAGGETNLASGQWATVSGGLFNRGLARLTTIGGGGSDSAVAPARGNVVYDELGTIAGGTNNQAGIDDGNLTAQSYAAVGGGAGNRAFASLATIAGGGGTSNAGNAVYDVGGAVGGGSHNTAGRNDANSASQSYVSISGGNWNSAAAAFAAIGGGGGDVQADGNAVFDAYGTIGGGQANQAGANDSNETAQEWATVGGGYTNRALALATTIAGGFNNAASGTMSVIGGGNGNSVGGPTATVGGGQSNNAAGTSATIPGGAGNSAAGAYAFAAGHRAAAASDGCFVWADSNDADLTCNTTNRFVARASGGVVFFTNSAASTGVQVAAGGGSWSSASDRALKTNISPVDGRIVLAKLVSTPIHTWSYISQDPSIRHIGPMAQDFQASFGVGEDDRHITNVDADGVALAAIQGLYQLLHARDAEIATLSARLAALEAHVASQPATGTHRRRRQGTSRHVDRRPFTSVANGTQAPSR
jgi:hypothetical protein